MPTKSDKTDILGVLANHLANSKGDGVCSMGAWINTLDDKSKEMFTKIIESKNINISKLYSDLIQSGIELPVRLTAFRSHLKGYCTCQKV
jgi:hypothetical protein